VLPLLSLHQYQWRYSFDIIPRHEDDGYYHDEEERFVATTTVAASPPLGSSSPKTTTSELHESPYDPVVETESPTLTGAATTTTDAATITDRQLSPLMRDILHQAKIGFYFGMRKLSPLTRDLLHRAKIGFYFGLWYAFNVAYNGAYD
jgi:hypothetical protein